MNKILSVSYTHLDVYKRQDSCRLWDMNTNDKMDKDRFRRDMGGVLEGYKAVLERLKG